VVENRKKTMALTLIMLTVIMIIGVSIVKSFATEATLDTTTTDTENQTNQEPFFGLLEPMISEQRFDVGRGHRGKSPGGMNKIEISTEYTENVNDILEADPDMQTLLEEGYNVTSIEPEIKTVIESDGTISTKAATARVILQNNLSGYAIANVDVSQAKVTQIIIYTRTVIDKTIS
jgi:hypothetical protein